MRPSNLEGLGCLKIENKNKKKYMKIEPAREYNQDQTLWRIKVGYDLLNQLDSVRNIIEFQVSSRRENR